MIYMQQFIYRPPVAIIQYTLKSVQAVLWSDFPLNLADKSKL